MVHITINIVQHVSSME